MKVAVLQYAPEFKSPKNVLTLLCMVDEAVAEGAGLIVAPELCLTGYSFMSRQEAENFGLPVKNVVAEHLAKRAAKYSVAIVWGFLEKSVENLYNSQAIVLPDGDIRVYRKQNLWGNDFLWATPGDENPPIVDFGGVKVGLLICRDIRDKTESASSIYEPGDADIVAFSANFGDGGFPAVSWMDFAKSNKTYLAVSNRYGREANNNFGEGGICVISPDGQVQCDGLVWNKPCMVLADVPV